jgi:hypothetical protein
MQVLLPQIDLQIGPIYYKAELTVGVADSQCDLDDG